MSRTAWLVLENIALLAAMCFLVWATGNGWWCLLALFLNTRMGNQ